MASENLQQVIQKKLGSFPAAVIYALLEWVLILLLFLDGILSFAANEYARFFGLKIPCLFCTRIDHVLLHKDSDFYYKDSICDTHRQDISSLAYCHVHESLSDIRWMCADCLLSFATEKKSTSETYRSLMGIFDAKLQISIKGNHKIHLKLPVSKEEDWPAVENERKCSCCGGSLRTWISPHGCEALEIPVPFTVPVDRKPLMVMRNGEPGSFDMSSQMGYMELKFTSESEAEYLKNDISSSATMTDNDIDMDKVMDLSKFSESLDRSFSKTSVTTAEEPPLFLIPLDHYQSGVSLLEQRRSISSGLDVKEDAGLKHGLEELSWDKVMSPQLSNSSMFAPKENGKEASAVAGLVNPSENEGKEAEGIDLNEAYKIAMDNKLTNTNGMESGDESEVSWKSRPPGLPPLRKRSSAGKDKSVDPPKGKDGNRAHWKSMLHRLKRQVHLDRKSLIELSTELDQERSAAAVAVNQAMAMITRVQEEKAAVQMEALHYQRLMEEQVEYDQDALQTLRDLLIKREKKIEALEAEVESYRETFRFELEKNGEEDNFYAEMTFQDNEKVLADTIYN